MKLTRLRLQQFKQFAQPLEIDGLQPGINLFVGPNESGKSTLAQAIRAAFFERHKSSSVSELQPWGDSGAAPEVALDFQWQDEHWHLEKRFLKSQRCDLRIGQQSFDGDEADEKLAELLGYSFAGRGASKPEHHGIPGLLWVEQGAAQDIEDPVGYADDYLQNALGASLGGIASSGGDALIARVEDERGALLTKGGQARSDYKALIAQCEEDEAQLKNLEAQIETYRKQVDRLGELRLEQQNIDAASPWEEQRKKAEQAQEKLEQVAALQSEQQRAQKTLDDSHKQQQLYRQQLQSMAAEEEQLKEREKIRQEAERKVDQCRAKHPQFEQQLDTARKTYKQAVATLKQTRQQADRERLQGEHQRLVERLAEQDKTLEKARTLHKDIQRQRENLLKTAVDADPLKALKECEAALAQVQAQQKAVATRLTYRLEAEKSINIGDETVTGDGETLLLEATDLTIPGVGALHLQPGGKDVAELLREHERLLSKRDSLLQQLGVSSLQQAEQRARENSDLHNALAQNQTRLEMLAPEGVDDLASRCQLDEQARITLAEKLEQLPAGQPDLPSLADAETSEEKAGEALKTAEDNNTRAQTDLKLAESSFKNADQEWQGLRQTLESPERKERETQANKQLVDLGAEETRLSAELDQRQQQIDDADPQTLEQDVQRFSRSAEALKTAAREREREVSELEVRLDEQGARGLEEQHAELQQQHERRQRRRDELSRRAGALDLLLTLLREKRQALTRQLQAPLQKHLNHYLKLLFPQAQLSVDEHLVPETLTRTYSNGEERGRLQALSFGSREQLGLISRLAYADLLREADQPTLIILDDALVHSDSARREQMKRILFDAAQRHQILLLTCHPENWRDLGVAAHDMQALKVGAA